MSERPTSSRYPVLTAAAVVLLAAGAFILGSRPSFADVWSQGGFTTSAAVSPASVAPGGAVSITASVTSSAAASAMIVDLEVYGPGGKVHQQFWENQAFSANQTRTFTTSWTVPAGSATGTYTAKIGIFTAGWASLPHWNDIAATFGVGGTTASPTPTPSPAVSPPPPTGLRVQGNRLVNSAGQSVRLYGVNRSGTEYACVQGWGFADGPVDLAAVQAIASWTNTNVVRVPMNEHCWLARNAAPAAYSGASYQQFIAEYVQRLNSAGLIAMLELHWTGAGTTLATGQQAMLNRDHSIEFWRQVASHPTFKNNQMVIFDPHNEPYPDSNQDTTEAWRCWRDGGTCAGVPFQAAGMQEIVNTIRGAGANNMITLGGVRYASTLSQWLTYKPSDPVNNLIAAWHIYSFVGCVTPSCWDSTAKIGPTAQSAPVIAGEFGADCGSTTFVQTVADYLDSHQGAGYLGWVWNIWGQCHDLITNYNGTPTSVWGQWLKDRFASRTSSSSPSPSPTPTPTSTPQPTPTTAPTPSPTSTPTPTPTPTPLPTPTPAATATPSPTPPPGLTAPSNLTATAVASQRVDLLWTDNATGESGYRIERSTDGVNFAQIATVGADARTYTDSSVRQNRRYYYRVRAYTSSAQSAFSNTVSVRTPRK